MAERGREQTVIDGGSTAVTQGLFTFFSLLLWELCVGLVQTVPSVVLAHITPFQLPHFSMTAFFSASVTPHRAYALSVCLLE